MYCFEHRNVQIHICVFTCTIVFADLHFGTYFLFCLPSRFLIFSVSFPLSLIACTGNLTYLAIRSAAYRACLIASPISISILCIMGTTRRRDAATTAHSTPSMCQTTACVCSALMARTLTVLVLSIALSSLLLGAPLCNSRVAVNCGLLQCVAVLQCSAHEVFCCATHLLQSLVASASFASSCMAMSLFNVCWLCGVFCMCLRVCWFVFVIVYIFVCVSVYECFCVCWCLCEGLCVGF